MKVIFDIDGVLADLRHRLPYIKTTPKNYDAFYAACIHDKPIYPLISIASMMLRRGYHVEAWTGRPESSRYDTENWLRQYGLSGFEMIRMRPDNNHSKSDILKKKWLNSSVEQPDLVFEDSASNTEMFRDAGILVCQTAPDEIVGW